ncbi:irregular chiasm C-roughest protein isoform X2 [Folsomia candida]|uniref:Irregular chiasm C-roughest protein n=1 Tax=Folsomia candida TaxID=158441 RepID=A0A226ENG6_FOLCA|nr:irregular chiasm C-roughest protein isoform X2 [Folsomia candida]OXA59029.1 Irregular chiasm C-roughest protein [Folsomia candida]
MAEQRHSYLFSTPTTTTFSPSPILCRRGPWGGGGDDDGDNGTPSCTKVTTKRRVTRRLSSNKSASYYSSAITMPLFLVFLVMIELSLATPAFGMAQQHFRRTPDNQTATVGDMVTLACSVINKSGVLQWTRDGFGLGTERNLVGYERYRMQGSEEEGDYTLVIDEVTLEDDAIFQCQVGPGPPDSGVRELRSADAKLTIDVPTGSPQILQGDFLQTTEDREIQLECISRAGKPPAEITWIDGSGQEIKTGVEPIKEPLDDGKRFNSRSILKFQPKKEHHNKTFTCQAHNRPAKEVMSVSIRLEVKYAPKVTVKIQSPKTFEHDTVRVSCKADANPPDMIFRWFRNDQVIAGDHGTLLVLHNVSRKLDDSIIKCEVQNSVGKSEESETLEVFYGPVFRKRPQNMEGDLGSTITLNCDVDGNPAPEIVWFHEPTRNAVSTSPNHTVTVTEDTQGKYVCQAVVQGFPQISAIATVSLKGPPRIESHRVQYGTMGDTIRLECLARSIPKPDRITWTHLGREIDNNDSDYSILEDPTPFGVRSILVIRSSQEKDFGRIYNCSVTNPYGTHMMEIYLFKQKGAQLMWILTFVIGGVVLIVAVTMITLLCQRKAVKPDLMEIDRVEKQTKQSDSSNDSDLKVEIRTASSLSNIPEHDSEHWDEGSDALKNESIYRYSDYIDPVFPPKHDGHNNNGYVPYVDYARDYNPNHTRTYNTINHPPPHMPNNHIVTSPQHQYLNNVDPRYSATYGNPYLRTSNSSLPPPHSGGQSPNSHPLAQFSHTAMHNNHSSNNLLNNHVGVSHHLMNNHHGSNHLITPTTSAAAAGQPPYTTTTAINNVTLANGSTSPHTHNNPLSNSTNPYGMRNGGVSHHPSAAASSRGSSTPSPQYIVPAQSQLKPGTLATHV